ncbi:MAG: VWA domain-containing protein [Proteobacteria bacterium]|nr:VWA domain-containing protein [Pseudomonadota bacterium]
MRRIIFDVPKWSLYMHRAARGLHRAEEGDAPPLQMSDELFERLFAGEAEALSDHGRDRVFGDWAQRIHDTVTQLPAFERLAAECRGRADESAMAVEALIDELRPDGKDDELRRSARTACGKASHAVEQLRDAMDGLEHVSFDVPGTGVGTGTTGQPNGNVRSLAARLRDDPRLRKIANLAGRFKRIAGAKRRSRVRHGADEIVDVEQGADLGRLLPLELAQLVHPRTRLLALRNFVERQCMQYRLEGAEPLGRGPLVLCVDKSGSMEGERDVWATSVALALLSVAQAEKRAFALLGFDAAVRHESIVLPGESLPEAGLFIPCDGGTNIDAVLRRGLDVIHQHHGSLRKADIVLITDGGSNADNAQELRDRAAKLGVTILGVAIDVEPDRLMPWCEQVVAANDMSRLDDRAAEVLFAGQ